MTHRADQVIDAAAALIDTQASGVTVYTHNRFSLFGAELPAISVDYGEDTPIEQVTGFIDSLLSLQITGVAVSPDEADVREELLRLRRDAHIALMADETLGLAFVVTTTYGGANAPEIDTSGEVVVGALTSIWQVYYRMNLTDPGDG